MIRKIEEKDIPKLLELELQLFPDSPWPEKSFRYELDENPFANMYGYEKDGKLVGYADLWIMYEQAQISNIGVDPACQKAGIASEMMDHCIREALKNGCENLTLEVRVSNMPAIRLYEKYGFVQAAVRRQYYENGEDAYLMVKPLGGLNYEHDTGN